MLIVFGKRNGAGRWCGLALCAGVSAAPFAGAACQGVKRAGAVAHVAPVRGATGAVLAPGVAQALLEMGGAASVVFAGHVEAVARNDAAGFADVRFRIDQAVRGCPENGVYVLREWAGLWIGHPERYRVGERLLMLLAARGPSGMSAPVGGTDGAIPLVGVGVEPLANGTGIAPPDDGSGADAAASVGVDLRWIAARAVRGVSAGTGPQRAVVSGGAVGRPVLPLGGDPAVEGWSGPVAPLTPVAGANGSGVEARPSLSAILALLRGGPGVAAGVNDGAR